MALIISLPLLVCLCAFEKKKWNKRRKPFDSVNRFKLHLVLPQSGKNKIWRCAVANLWRDVIVEKCYQKQFKKLRLKQDCLQDREWETVKRKKNWFSEFLFSSQRFWKPRAPLRHDWFVSCLLFNVGARRSLSRFQRKEQKKKGKKRERVRCLQKPVWDW